MNGKLIRPNDKVLYAPIRHNNQKQQAMRSEGLGRRMMAASVRPEKKNGLRR